MRDITEAIEPYPVQRRRLQSKKEFQEVAAARRPEDIDRKRRRLDWLGNQLVEASIKHLPRSVRRRWRGSTCVDATPLRLWARGTSDYADWASIEPDAGWYSRDTDHRDWERVAPHSEYQDPETLTDAVEGKGRKHNSKKSFWAHEATFFVSGPDDPGDLKSFPNIVLALTVHKPATEIAAAATRCGQSLVERGHPTGWLAADRAYFPNSQVQLFQRPLREMGYELIGTHRLDQLGMTAEHEGAIQVEGLWYCPSMPSPLVEALVDYKTGQITKDTFDERMRQRERYVLRPRSNLRTLRRRSP